LRQVELSVQESPSGELAGFGNSRPKLQAAIQQKLKDYRAAMPLNFDDVLAGVRPRRREEK
jgi:hypothetical protein